MSAQTAECRWCGMRLQGKPYFMGGNAYHPRTGERAKINHYGGFVCSKACDRRSSLDLERSMPGHGANQQKLSCYAEAALKRNWA
ncbi:hypothetical protein [Acetobacter sp. P5B1]|uniref:hypothetical protein n=1 Tax=Acetobacter sp. P5B1 TaxID=2762620 RepID=UPI001C03B0EC|nr:hypothetical protein [Acetobacter sp. P5B1]